MESFSTIPMLTDNEMAKEVEQTLIDTYGSVEEGERYANMELTENIMHPNPDAGIEENLADKIAYARGYVSVMKGLPNARPEDLPELNMTLTSFRTSGKRHF